MGQYHIVINLDKRQYLHPHKLTDGLKLMEFGASHRGTMMCLAVLLADSNGRGGGDCRCVGPNDELVGSWAGDRIVITGDYGDDGKFYGVGDKETAQDQTLWELAEETFRDISDVIRDVVSRDTSFKGHAFEAP